MTNQCKIPTPFETFMLAAFSPMTNYEPPIAIRQVMIWRKDQTQVFFEDVTDALRWFFDPKVSLLDKARYEVLGLDVKDTKEAHLMLTMWFWTVMFHREGEPVPFDKDGKLVAKIDFPLPYNEKGEFIGRDADGRIIGEGCDDETAWQMRVDYYLEAFKQRLPAPWTHEEKDEAKARAKKRQEDNEFVHTYAKMQYPEGNSPEDEELRAKIKLAKKMRAEYMLARMKAIEAHRNRKD